MERFKSILVAASVGQLEVPVLKAAARLTAPNDGQITVLDVIEPLSPRRRTVSVEGQSVDLEELLLRDRREQLRQAVEKAGIKDAVVEVTAGKPFVETIRYAMTHSCDVVIVGESPSSKGSPRSVAPDVMQLLRTCPTPVWVMCPSRARKLRVLALVDPDPDDPLRDSLNDLVLELATSIVRREGGELHVAHAWDLLGESTLRYSAFASIPEREVDLMVQAAGDEHHAQLDELTKRYGVDKLGGQTHILKGAAAKVLPELADRLHINLIVMGTVARTGLGGLIMGNTAETMLRSVRCSVLTVKPEGFVSPVEPDPRG
ncbi:MAG TPA: universal stress protein [Acidimicrobiia bacterium]|nr:universal stress protein [Acidimicrobiia bacterium]